MSKKIITVFVCICVMCLMIPTVVFGAGNKAQLEAISFKNAKINESFSSDVLEYTITLEDNTISPTLESYTLSGDAQLFIDYTLDETNHRTGITATVSFETGGGLTYAFLYSNPPEYVISSDNALLDIYCEYGELDTELNDEDSTYIMYVPSDLKQLTIIPTPRDINASCARLDVTLGENASSQVNLNCVASDGGARVYKIKIRRVNKTLEQVKEEMKSEDYVTFVEGTHFYEKQGFYVVAVSISAGAIILFALIKIMKKLAINPFDKDEKPFYSLVE